MTTRFEERDDHFGVFVLDDEGATVFAVPVNKTVPEADGTLHTTEGFIPVSILRRSVIFEDRPTELVVAVEWQLKEKLVRRDVNVILKKGSAVADAVAATIGG